jgi:methionine-gamma-lyase
VFYPGLPDHPGRHLLGSQMKGPGSMISFVLKGGYAAGVNLLNSVRLCVLAVSLGSIETLIQHPASMTHSGMTPAERAEAGIAEGLVRLSVGCEEAGDLIGDLKEALEQC